MTLAFVLICISPSWSKMMNMTNIMSQFVIVCMLMLAFKLKHQHTAVQSSWLGSELSFISRWSWTVWLFFKTSCSISVSFPYNILYIYKQYTVWRCGVISISLQLVVKVLLWNITLISPRVCPYPCLPLGCLCLSSVSLWPPLPLDGERVRVLGLLELRTPMEALRWFCRKHPCNPKQTRASQLILQQFKSLRKQCNISNTDLSSVPVLGWD